MTMRALGPFNGTLPIPTGMAIAFVRDAKKFPFMRYMQLVPTEDINFMYFKVDTDEPTRLITLNKYAWGYDDYRPSGRDFTVRGDWTASVTSRYDFPWQIGEETLKIWRKQGMDPQKLYNKILLHKANLHRAQRCLDVITGATYEQSGSLNDVMDTTGAYWDASSGVEHDPASGAANPNFQIIKKTFMRVNRKLKLATNNVAGMEDMVCVMSPVVAEAISTSGEIVNLLKQSQYAEQLKTVQYAEWGLPEELYNVKIVVEDSPRVFINQKADGTIADVDVSSERDFILNTDSVYFGIRPGGIDGGFGEKNFATWQLYHRGGESRIEAFSDPKHELVEGHVVMEDVPLAVATVAGFKITDVLSV